MYFRGRGRIGRRGFWLYGVLSIITLYFLVGFIVGLFGYHLDENHVRLSVYLFAWPLGAVQLKRWHDRGKGSVWLLVNLVPIVGLLWVFVELGLLPGSPESNRFGPPSGAEKTPDKMNEAAP